MKRLFVGTLVVVCVGLAGSARGDGKTDPTGTWKWSSGSGNRVREATLRLKLEGGKLTGALLGRGGRETAIQDAEYRNGEVSFTVSRERNGQTFTTKYKGKVSGDTIKGTMESERNGQTRTRDWSAKRAAS